MEPYYPLRAWSHSTEVEVIDCIQELYSRKGYKTKNLHSSDRVHELGVDLECERDMNKILFAVKMKPRKDDRKQLSDFAETAKTGTGIYVFIENPTRPFDEFSKSKHQIIFWDAIRLHKELVEGEIPSYLRLLFAILPISDTLTKINEVIYMRRNTSYQKRKLTSEELDKLWVAKDNIVKMRSMLLFTYTRWTKRLMNKTNKEPSEYQALLDEVFEDLDTINHLSGEKLVASFEELANKNPDILGLYWDNISQRTNWKYFTHAIEKVPEQSAPDFIRFSWVTPRLEKSTLSVMRGFYSSINYILENFHTVALDIEDGIDWVFEDMRP